ncbi:AsmA-like C-terminal region-containing protein [Aureimonas frigidaquae]|uniref:Uncharacterized protein n=1 Tax=Aureimonas frigidaquae TaxID=424757 RepID=A0A0P0Z3I6_9HYPH|nr:AsmA-like C-terminal region-containing protein [Aureimonas frigidaquae]BAT28342.1 hypothetical protein [Aureimonas frigidaquae]
MRLMRRGLALLALLLLIALIVVGGGAFFLLGTEAGQAVVRARAEGALARLMGPRFVTRLGDQSYELRRDGSLAVTWSDVGLAPRDRPEAETVIDHFGVAIRLVPLVSGGLEFGRFEVSGARIDLDSLILPRPTDSAAQPPSTTPVASGPDTLLGRSIGGLIQNAERHVGVLRNFHFDTLEFTDISIVGIPQLDGPGEDLHVARAELRRSESGGLDLVTAIDVSGMPVTLSGQARFSDETGRLDHMELRSGQLQLRDVAPPGDEADPLDERPFGTDIPFDLRLDLARKADDGPMSAELTVNAGAGALQLGTNHTRLKSARLALRYRSDTENVTILPSPFAFRDVAFTLSGTVSAAPSGSGTALDRLAFDLDVPDLRSTVGSGAERTGTLALAGTFDPAARLLRLDEASLATQAGSLTAEAQFGYGAPDSKAQLDVTASNLSAASIKAFWPFNIAGRARRWVLDHMGDAAKVRTGAIRIDTRRDRLDAAFGKLGLPRDDEFGIDLDIYGADLKTVGALPPLYAANGRLETRGDETRVTVDTAQVQGLETVRLSDSTVTLFKPTTGYRRDLMIDLAINARGDVPQILDIAARDPLNALRRLDIDPKKATGTGSVAAQASLRVGRYIEPEDQVLDWGVTAHLDKANPGSPIEGRNLEAMTGDLSIRPGRVEGKLSALMDSIPTELALTIPFGNDPGVARRIDAALAMNEERLAKLVPGLDGIVKGEFALNARIADGPTHLDADLTQAAIQIPTIAWSKGKGVAARLELDLQPDGQATKLSNITLKGDGFSAAGTAVTDGQGLRSAALTQLALNQGDDAKLTARRTDNGYAIDIKGSKFDARPILQDMKSTAGQDRSGKRARGSLDVVANIDSLGGFNGVAMQRFAMNYASRSGRLVGLSISGVAGEGQVAGDLSKRDGLDAISLSSANTGALLAFSGLYANMKGGRALLELSGTADRGYVGRLRMLDFTLVDEPRLERIVGSTPVQGKASLAQAVGKDLRTSQAYFDQASADLSYRDGALRVANGIVRGPVFGSSFDGQIYDRDSRIDISGSFMPAYGINRVFGALPLVGQILGNGNEGGLIGITYRLAGPFGAPTLTVNPISLIAPGIFRQIFAYE